MAKVNPGDAPELTAQANELRDKALALKAVQEEEARAAAAADAEEGQQPTSQ